MNSIRKIERGSEESMYWKGNKFTKLINLFTCQERERGWDARKKGMAVVEKIKQNFQFKFVKFFISSRRERERETEKN
jgi:hypothetical protein